MDYERALIDLIGKRAERNKLLKDRATEIQPTSLGEFALGRLGTALRTIQQQAAERKQMEMLTAQQEAEQQAKQQQLEARAKQSLFGTVLRGGGELPEDYMGMPKGYRLPPKPTTPKQITRTVHDPSGFYFITFDPATGQTQKTKVEGVEGKQLSQSAMFMFADKKTQDDIHAAEKRFATDLREWEQKYMGKKRDFSGNTITYVKEGAPPRPRLEAYYEIFPSTTKFAQRVANSRGTAADYMTDSGTPGVPIDDDEE